MKKEIRLFFSAMMFYTRIPCPKNMPYCPEDIHKSSRYFPLIGWLVALISYVVFCLSHFLFSIEISALLSLMMGVFVTGAFHEDGWADACDGFGGGWTKSKILDIMKDSRVGAFGAIGLIFLLLLKYLALAELLNKTDFQSPFLAFLCLVTYHALARLTAIQVAFVSQYSRDDATSKVKPIAQKHGLSEIILSHFFGYLPLAVLCYFHWAFGLVLLPLALLVYGAKRYFEKWIDGYTGDCLGAVEQLAEVLCLLNFLALCKYIPLGTLL